MEGTQTADRHNDDADAADYRYWAFLSYSHRDSSRVKKIHRRLENWRVPRRLVGRNAALGAIPTKFFPIYRDRDETAGGESLDEVIRASLRQSRYLIVICSPYSASSHYVNEEIRFFKRLGRSSRIMYLIISGEPGGPRGTNPGSSECFPELAYHRVRSDGTTESERIQPVAQDARGGKDGLTNALLKLFAQMLTVPFADLKRRDIKQRHQARAIATTGLGCILVLAVAVYVAVADAGTEIPLSTIIRDQLDRRELSYFRPVPSDGQIDLMERTLVEKLMISLRQHRQADNWINDHPPVDPPGVSTMSHAQALAAAFHQQLSPSDSSWAKASLELFFSKGVPVESGGLKWGWGWTPTFDNVQSTQAYVPLWLAIALGEASNCPENPPNAALRQRLLSEEQYVQEVLQLYQPKSAPGAWNSFPYQTDLENHSDYCGMLAVMALVATHNAGLPWDGSAENRDQILLQTASRLISTYKATGSQRGWQNTQREEHASYAYDGLTAETYAALLEADLCDTGFQIPNAMAADIEQYLVNCNTRTADFPIDVSDTFIASRHVDGTVRLEEGTMHFLWWPWCIRCAHLWLEYARRNSLPNEQQVAVRRTLAHLVIDLGPREAEKSASSYSYVISEALFCLAPRSPTTKLPLVWPSVTATSLPSADFRRKD